MRYRIGDRVEITKLITEGELSLVNQTGTVQDVIERGRFDYWVKLDFGISYMFVESELSYARGDVNPIQNWLTKNK